jgi:peptidoglycan-associated lipoprotein
MEEIMKPFARRYATVAACAVLLFALGCAKKKTASVVPPVPPAPTAPTVSVYATPSTIDKGQSTELKWTSENATEVTLQGVGAVDANGSRSVSPTDSTTYTVIAKGPGGSREASARVTVNLPAMAPPAQASLSDEDLFARNVKDVYFDYDRYSLRDDQLPISTNNAEFLKKHPHVKVTIEGHCDERGSEEYNLALGESRAQSLREKLVASGVSADQVAVVSYGKEKPFCTDNTEECWQQNRRDHVVLKH